MRHKLLYLLALALTTTSSGWGQDVDTLVYSSGGKLCKMILPQTPSNPALETIPSCFANGNPVRVYLDQTSGRMIVETIETDGGTPDTLQFEPGKFGVFGGSLGKAVTSASITLESGSIRSICGGGVFVGNAGTGKTTQAVVDKYSYKNSDGSSYTPVSADVSDAVSIEIKPGAVVRNLLLGGGRYYAKTNTVNIKADQATIRAICAGGYDQGQTTNTLTTDVDASVNGVKNVNMTLSKCTIPEGLGTGGGQGYTHTGTSVVTVTDSELGAIYGTSSNGYADEITVNVTNSTFKKQYKDSDIQYRELASINRGGVKNISFTFDGCSFEEPESIVAGLGAVDGWADSDTNGKPQPIVNGNVSYKFINSKTETPTFSVGRGLDNANIELTGAKASLRHFVDGTAIPQGLSEFTLSADKTWTFNDGLEMQDGVTFTNNGGSLNIGVSNAKDLQAVLTLVNKKNIGITSVKLNNDLDLSTLSDVMSDIGSFQGIINIQKPLIFDGCGHAIRNSYPNPNASKSYYVVKLDAASAGSTIKNLTIENTNATALDIITRTKRDGEAVYLNDVTLKNNEGGGLNVNISKVVATNLKTSGNKLAAVRVARDNDTNNTHPYFELKGDCKLEEEVKIAYNAKENPATYDNPALSTTIAERLAMVSIQTNDKEDWKTTWQLVNFRAKDAKYPALSWTNDFDTSSIQGKVLAKMTSGAELDSLFTWGGATVDGISWNNTVGDACVSDVTLDKSFAVVGTDSTKCIIKGNWNIKPSDPVEVSLSQLTLTGDRTTASNDPLIGINGTGKVNLSLTGVAINPTAEGSGSSTSKSYRHAAIQGGANANADISLSCVSITLSKNYQAGYLNYGQCNFSMGQSNIKSTAKDGSLLVYPIWLEGKDNSACTITDSEINIGADFYYAVRMMSPKQNLVVDKSILYAWAGIYMQGAWYGEDGADGMTAKVTNSTITGVGKSGSSNGFGVIVFEATDNSSVELENTVINNVIYENKAGKGFLTPITFQIGGGGSSTQGYRPSMKPSKNCWVSMKGCTLQNKAEETTLLMVDYNNVYSENRSNYLDYFGNKISIDKDTKILNQDGSNSILVQQGDTLRNATKSLSDALVYKNEQTIIPVAYPNDRVMAAALAKDEALTSLNAVGAIPEGYSLPDGIVILCKDIAMVVGADKAEAYASANPEAVVSVLKQNAGATPLFALEDCSAILEISADTEWATARTGRKVKILDGATLTITAPMDLGTVVMEEGAQLKSTVAESKVTAQELCFAPKLSGNNWKALGVPFTPLEVKDSKGVSVSAPSAQEADDGIWFADLKNNKTPIFEVKTDNFGAAGLWAANGDTYTISSEGAFEFKDSEEPTAPTETGTFLMCSNPNTFTITLKQSAYILTTDGTSFEQEANPEIKPFQSFVLTDTKTLSTLRSLRLGDSIVTGTQVIEPMEGYYVTTERGAIVIHTPEPMDVAIIGMNGKVAYRGEVTDGQRIMVPSGIYAVNGQLVRVK